MNERFAINDLLDAVEKLAAIVKEIAPGKSEDYRRIDFLLKRADRELNSIFPNGEFNGETK